MPQHVRSGALFADDARERERLTMMLNTINVTLSFTGRLADHATHECSGLDLRLMAIDATTPAGLSAILALPIAPQPPICLFYPAFTLNGVLLACSVGVNGHALSTTSADDLDAGLQVIAQNGLFFCPTIWAGFAQGYLQPVHRLTLRDVQLLALVANGETNRVIAQVFAVSTKLVERQIQHLCTKVGVRNRTELAAWWGRQLAEEPSELTLEA